jgi:O-methyltransferase domain
MRTMYNFDDYLIARKSLTEPDDALNNPYTYRHNQDGIPVWEIMSQYPERIQAFQLGFTSQEASVPVVGLYDFSQLNTLTSDDPDRTILVDVGGDQGQSIAQILTAHPDLRASKMVLQDLPHPIAQARLSTSLPTQVLKMEHDFFTPQPIKRARAYYLRRISHDYSDADNVRILSHLANVMAPDSRVLIADMVMPRRVGEADLAAAVMDCTVMVMGGKERTEEGFRAILEQAGLVLVRVWRASVGAGALVEAKLK